MAAKKNNTVGHVLKIILYLEFFKIGISFVRGFFGTMFLKTWKFEINLATEIIQQRRRKIDLYQKICELSRHRESFFEHSGIEEEHYEHCKPWNKWWRVLNTATSQTIIPW
jgi:hypothetical protein